MEIEIKFSEIEEYARNKNLFDIGSIIEKDILTSFMSSTEKCMTFKFGTISIREEHFIINIEPKSFIEFTDIISKVGIPIIISGMYMDFIKNLIKESINTFNNEWEVIKK